MEEKLVSYNVAKLAKEVGFSVVTEYRFFYNSELTTKTPSQSSKPTIYAPTQGLLQKWLREIHNIEISVRAIKWENTELKTGLVLDSYEYEMYPLNKPYYIYHKVSGFKTYEQALEQAILESLKLIKNEKI